jgi:hypothetical protein
VRPGENAYKQTLRQERMQKADSEARKDCRQADCECETGKEYRQADSETRKEPEDNRQEVWQ